ncbi:hypothetical protein F441_12149 [Phytophthora nicotianae CJ01A1]|uniref:Uncharacterized protein n=7 Tax=Phytophthora nicotianae TaxID=4792 RepID=V9EV60_PHYNI|nr:hypothetical protein F443_12173 [Phytophthora nicotianae P1569]ETK82793.1 hypothetical protein L915_11893 [Phytophthora nicotianae]ETL36171.1 hypothetical protein L916_11821 [Phytophthora nicotianae]ETM42675.1 hypothetical protein L914_11725 [Phytophthora nicotianae]ETP12499.1 hypothetical protein F441_12149 [Phytophthora nicotianae CJ01A1]
MPLTLAQAQRNSRSLYRLILRESRQLEPNTREFYRRFARSVQVTRTARILSCYSSRVNYGTLLVLLQGFQSHANDTDPTAIQEHIRRVEQDIHCVLLDHGLHSS